jgi:alcohol dehydrogenase class IV
LTKVTPTNVTPTTVPPVVDIWSNPTTVCTGGLRQLPGLLGGRAMLLVADERLATQIDAVHAVAPSVEVVRISVTGSAEPIADSMRRHPAAVPVALGGGSVLDVVRLAALAAADPGANGLLAAADGPTFLPTRVANPTVCIPSTLGTGSEVSPVAVRQSPAGIAMIVSPGLRSAAAIIDPRMTASLTPAALAAGLVEPWARACVPAIAGERLRFQDGLASALAATLLALGDELTGRDPDDGWRSAAALASMQTHLGLLAVGRVPAGHVLWPLATEVTRVTALTKPAALAALVPAWLRCIAAGAVSRAWGAADRVDAILGLGPAQAAARLENWLQSLSLPTSLPAATDIDAVVARVVDPWQSSGVFLPGAPRAEIAAVVRAACADG